MIQRFSPYNKCGFPIALLSAAMAVFLPCYAGDGVKRLEDLVARGDEAYIRNDMDKAASLYREAYNQLPDSRAGDSLKKAVSERYEKCGGSSVGAVGASTAEGTTAVAGGRAYSGIESRAIARLDEKTQAAMVSLDKARELYREKNYEESLKEYKDAYDTLPDIPLNKKRRAFIAESMADASAAVAQEYISVGRYDEARKLLDDVLAQQPNHHYAKRVMTTLEDPIRSNPSKTPGHVARVKEVERLLLLGYGYYDLGKFDDAKKSFESVLRLDNTNTAARRGMEQVEKRKTAYLEAARDQRRASALTEISEAWEEEVPRAGLPEEPDYITGDVPQGNQDMDAKIKSLVIPRIDFDSVDLVEAVEFLRQQSVKLDEGAITAEKGVNIIINLGDPDSETAKNVLSKKFNLTMRNVPMSEVVQYIAQATGTSVYTTAYSVEFTTDATDVPFQTRVIQLPPGFFSGASTQDSGSTAEVDPFADASASSGGLTIARVNPVDALKAMGVPFPEGASARFNAQNSTLFVYNKPQNLRLIENLVAAKASEQPLQVVVTATIMEVSEKTLKELGFDWIVNLDLDTNKWYGIGGDKTENSAAAPPSIPGVPLPGYGLMTGGLRTSTGAVESDAIDSLIQSGTSDVGRGDRYTLGKAPGFFSIRGVWAQAEVAVIMRGLDQKKGVDVLQKPSIIIRPGEKASFYAGREVIYPEEYEPPQIPTGRSNQTSNSQIGSMAVAPANPTSFTKREIGTILDVDVLGINEGKTVVNLALSPQIVEFDGFVNYGSPITVPAVDSSATGTNNLSNVVLTKNEILQPIFSKRGVTTSLSVETGQTVIFGGLKKARTVEFEDKVPFFGDLPMVGRLFRSEGKQEEREVLLMFVKAEIIDPGGNPILESVKSSNKAAFEQIGENPADLPPQETGDAEEDSMP